MSSLSLLFPQMLLRSLTRAKTLIKPSGRLQRFTTISISNEPIYQSHRYTPTLKSQPSHHQPHSIHHPTTTPAHTLLVRAGFLRQSSNGIWNLLPNSIRVLKKLENIVREEMESIGYHLSIYTNQMDSDQDYIALMTFVDSLTDDTILAFFNS